MPAGAPQIITDGSLDWSGGVDSITVTSLASALNPNGLQRNELAWLNNATVRDGGITQRWGWQFQGRIHPGSALFQGGFMYESQVTGYPYPIVVIGGHVYQLDPNFVNEPIDLSQEFGLFLPASATHCFFCQAEGFLIIQAGDMKTLPLFYTDNPNATAALRQSVGIMDDDIQTPAPGVNEIPAAGAMTYYQGRLWYAQGRTFSAGDIVANHNSGTLAFNFTDSVLEVTENPLCFGGDGFSVPTQSGDIVALFYNANLNSTLGQGQLLAGTQKAVYAMQVPVTRADWINSTSNTQPQMTVVQLVNGPVNDRSVCLVNGDVFYQTLLPGVTSLFAAVRDFEGWGNHDLASNENRVLSFVNRGLLRESSGIVFDNRMLQTTLPVQTPQGVVYTAIMPLDFIPTSNFGAISTQFNPVWEGIYEGLQILQLFVGNFGGLERAFAVVVSQVDGGIDFWELTTSQQSDYANPAVVGADGETRTTWIAETPAYNCDKNFDLKKMVGCELWVDKLFGEVIFKVEYRPDASPCWLLWHAFKQCQPRNSAETLPSITYPLTQFYPDARAGLMLPKPPSSCLPATNRPSDVAYQFQVRLTIKGYCRIRGILLYFTPVERELYKAITC